MVHLVVLDGSGKTISTLKIEVENGKNCKAILLSKQVVDKKCYTPHRQRSVHQCELT